MSPVVESATLRCLVLCAGSAGFDMDRVLGSHGLSATSFDPKAPSSLLPLPTVLGIVRELVTSRETGWALRGAARVPLGTMGVLDHLCSAAPTAGACLADFARYFALVAYRGSLSFDDDALVLTFDVDGVEPERTFVEATFGLLWSRLRAYLGQADACPSSLELRAPMDDHRRRAWAQTVGIEVTERCEHNRIVVSADLCDTPLRGSNGPLRTFLEGLAVAAQPKPTASWADRVMGQLESGRPDTELAIVAKQLAVSDRTLRRRLSDEGTSFSELRRRELQRRAEAMLSAGNLTHGEIAFALGFSEVSAFSRAFRRWTGLTPGTWRQLAPGA